MDASTIDRWIDALTDPLFLRWVLWGGFAVITLSLLVLMRTRWGQAEPLRKCVILSVVAHLLLACYSTTVHINAQSAGVARQRTAVMRVTEVRGLSDGDAESEEEANENSAATSSRPWEAFSSDRSTAPQGFDLQRPAPLEVAGLTRRAEALASPLEATPPLPAAEVGALQLPRPESVPVDDITGGPEAARSAEPIEAPQAGRREVAAAIPDDAPGPQPGAAAESGAQPLRRTTSGDVPAALLDPPGLPPQLSDAPAVSAPGSALTGSEDDLRNFAGGPADLNATDEGSSGASGLPDGGATAERATGGGGAGAVEGILQRVVGGTPEELVGPQPRVGPARASPRRERAAEGGTPEIYTARTAPNRGAITEDRGGSGETEGAVQAALRWLADNQSDDGRWDASRHGAGQQSQSPVRNQDRAEKLANAGAEADTGVTGLALLAFLGAGHTHLDGDHAETVRRGLEFLLNAQGGDGSLAGNADFFAAMYCHGMATCALSEAYGMTADPQLEEPLRRAIAYTLSAQHPTNGGWRYKPGDDRGDTSQLGWQLMALKSAELAGFDIPRRSREGMERFLRSVASGPQGGLASYRPNEQHNVTMTAEALVCRQFLGIANAASSKEAAEYVLQELPGAGVDNYYYWYYATLATFHLQGDAWRSWNQALREKLVGSQRIDGPESGSWDPDPIWGSYGGRVYSTALGTLSLEVYYRYLPLYAGHLAP